MLHVLEGDMDFQLEAGKAPVQNFNLVGIV